MQKLTKRTVDALSPTGVDHFIWDKQMSGFGVRISPKGQKSFLIQYRYQGRTQRMRLGRLGLITADEARRKARILLGEAEAGKNPALAASSKRKAPRLVEISERFIKEHVETRLKLGTQANYKSVLQTYILPAIGHKRITDITLTDLNALHTSLSHKPSQAKDDLFHPASNHPYDCRPWISSLDHQASYSNALGGNLLSIIFSMSEKGKFISSDF